MNSIMTGYWPLFRLYQRMRMQLMQMVTDKELLFSPGGANPPLGVLCREIGEVERAYIDSFKQFSIDFSYRNSEPGLERSVSRLVTWFAALDEELQATIEGLSEEDIQQRKVDRGGDFRIPVRHQLAIYQEALIIFYGKVSVYLKVMGKALPEHWHEWIG